MISDLLQGFIMTVLDLLQQSCNKYDNAIKLVRSLFQTCYNKLGTSSANTTCWQLVNRFVTTCCRLVTTCAFLGQLNLVEGFQTTPLPFILLLDPYKITLTKFSKILQAPRFDYEGGRSTQSSRRLSNDAPAVYPITRSLQDNLNKIFQDLASSQVRLQRKQVNSI